MTTVADALYQWGGMPVGYGIPPFVSRSSKAFFVDPVNGSDGNSGSSPKHALKSLYSAHYLMTSGNNDVAFLIGTGAAAGSCRLSTANATASRDTSLTTGELIWSKDACHLIGIAAPGQWSRARIATPTGTYTASTFGSNNFMTVSGNGCYFSNLSLYQIFSTGNAAEICLTVSGNYNVFDNTLVGGIQSAAALGGTGARCLKVSGGDNLFTNGIIGTDTVIRSVANSSIEFSGGAARNKFIGCELPVYTSSADIHMILGTGNACMDRYQLFRRCMFINAIASASTQADDAISFSTAAPGGMILLEQCTSVGFTKWGDTNGLANTYVSAETGAAASEGLAVNPS